MANNTFKSFSNEDLHKIFVEVNECEKQGLYADSLKNLVYNYPFLEKTPAYVLLLGEFYKECSIRFFNLLETQNDDSNTQK